MRTVLIGLIAVLLLALAGLALSQTVLKSLPVNVTVTANQGIGVYNDETATTEVTRWYFGEVKRGKVASCDFWVKNTGEAINLTLTTAGPEWITVTPNTLALAPGAIAKCTLSIAPSLTTTLGEVNASIEIKAGS